MIDAGDPSVVGAPVFDTRGFARLADGTRSGAARVDIGAVEAKLPRIVTTEIDEEGVLSARSLREAIDLDEPKAHLFAPGKAPTRLGRAISSRQQLMDDANVLVDDQTITSHVKRIRRKFVAMDAEFDQLETVYGAGYRWKPQSSATDETAE